MSVTGKVNFAGENDRASAFQRDTEVACLDFYGVTLDKYGIRAELTPTMCGAAMKKLLVLTLPVWGMYSLKAAPATGKPAHGKWDIARCKNVFCI